MAYSCYIIITIAVPPISHDSYIIKQILSWLSYQRLMTTKVKTVARGVSRALVVGESRKQPQEMFGPRLSTSWKCVETLEKFCKIFGKFRKTFGKFCNLLGNFVKLWKKCYKTFGKFCKAFGTFCKTFVQISRTIFSKVWVRTPYFSLRCTTEADIKRSTLVFPECNLILTLITIKGQSIWNLSIYMFLSFSFDKCVDLSKKTFFQTPLPDGCNLVTFDTKVICPLWPHKPNWTSSFMYASKIYEQSEAQSVISVIPNRWRWKREWRGCYMFRLIR